VAVIFVGATLVDLGAATVTTAPNCYRKLQVARLVRGKLGDTPDDGRLGATRSEPNLSQRLPKTRQFFTLRHTAITIVSS
jgi:hypothetical protein